MSVASRSTPSRLRYHADAYRFVFESLQYTQEKLQKPGGRVRDSESDAGEDEEAHITGQELLHGIRELALKRFGLLASTVFRTWGVQSTSDFGRIVFELVDRGEMRKTERDSLDDFIGVFDFEDALDREYRIETSAAFRN
jgi:uncharacterized repeat protein (TIGR04138 family)